MRSLPTTPAGAGFPARDADYGPLRNHEKLLDGTRQKLENFAGIEGVSEQAAAIQDGQRRIDDRTREMLRLTDLAVVQFSLLMLQSAGTTVIGEVPPGRDDPDAYLVRGGVMIARQR